MKKAFIYTDAYFDYDYGINPSSQDRPAEIGLRTDQGLRTLIPSLGPVISQPKRQTEEDSGAFSQSGLPSGAETGE